MLVFIDETLPQFVSYGATGGPTFKTTITEGHTGRERRNVNWSKARWKFSFSGALLTAEAYDELRAVFYVVKGRYSGFRFSDPVDYQMTDEQIAEGDGSTTTFELYKAYTFGTETYNRRILKAASGTDVVKVNGVTKSGAGVDYTFYPNTGYIVFNTPPSNTHPIVVSCDFDVPVRFNVDEINMTYEGYASQTAETIDLIDISLEVANSITGPA